MSLNTDWHRDMDTRGPPVPVMGVHVFMNCEGAEGEECVGMWRAPDAAPIPRVGEHYAWVVHTKPEGGRGRLRTFRVTRVIWLFSDFQYPGVRPRTALEVHINVEPSELDE